MKTTPDYSAYQNEPSEDGLKRLSKMADRQAELDAEIKKLEELLNEKKEVFRKVSEVELPELMAELGQELVKTTSGVTIEIKEKIRASISKANNQAAIAWLDENGHSGLVKRKFEIKFNKDEEGWANKFAADLRKRKKPVICQESKTVHASTLTSWVKGQLEEGTEIPLNLFGVFRQTIAELKVK